MPSIYLQVIFILIAINQMTIKVNCQCQWEFMQQNELKCNLRILDNGLNLQQFTDIKNTQKLDIQCNDDLYYSSELPNNSFLYLTNLLHLKIQSCKLQKLQSQQLNGLKSLKHLEIHTKNFEFGLNKNLEFDKFTFQNLNELKQLDLSDNNIKQLPDGLWCSLNNLKLLNLSMNHLREMKSIGFYDDQICTIDQQQQDYELNELDLSYNELQQLSDNWNSFKLNRLQHLKIQHNNITKFDANAFRNLLSLRTLNLSYNHLETLPSESFSNNKDLRELYLQQNELYELPKNLLNHLEQLLILDLSGNQLTSHHIDNQTFSGLIRLIILNLSNNALTRIGSNTFKELYFLQILNLRNNSIGMIENGSFLSLYNLHTLNLAENRLHTIDNKLFNGLFVLSKLTLNNNLINIIENDSFRNCSDLKELDLSSNQISEIPEAIKNLKMLKTLDLGENQISEFHNGSFKNLNQLTGLRLIDNRIGNITKGMFWDLPQLSVLNLAKNQIQSIERGAFDNNLQIEAIRLDRNYLTDINGVFATLASLLWLNLSDNHLIWFDYAFIPRNLKWLDIHNNFIEILGNYYKLQEEINLKTLDASHNRIIEIDSMSVPNSIELLFINNNLIKLINTNTFVDKIKLNRVDLYANRLTKLQLNSIRVAPFVNNINNNLIPEFYLGGNPFICDCSMEWLQRINNLTTRQHPKIMDLNNIDCLIQDNRNTNVQSLQLLKNYNFLCNYKKNCPSLCNCCDIDECNCEMICPQNCACYHDSVWSKNIIDCGNQNLNQIPYKLPNDLTDLYLDGNDLPILYNTNFSNKKYLKNLYLNSSNIIKIENNTFNNLIVLQKLYLNDNKLKQLNSNDFEHLKLLKELYLQNNYITTIDNIALNALKSLQILRIDNNRLINIQISQLLQQTKQNLQLLSMGQNSWSCNCKFLNDFKKFINDNSIIIQDPQDIYCIDSINNNKHEIDLNSDLVLLPSSSSPVENCNNDVIGNSNGSSSSASNQDQINNNGYIPLLAAVIVLIFLIVILIIVFVFRESVRVWLFAHYGVRVCESRFEDAGKLYDAILLHSSKDYDFVCRNIGNELENGRPAFRLCIQHRDLPSESSHLQIVEASRASRKIILILTKNLLQTEWQRDEFRSAFHESLRGLANKLVIIEEIDVYDLANDINELSPYLKLIPSNRILTSDTYFWEKLRYSIPIELSARSNNYTIDHHERFKQPVSPGVIFRQAPPPPAYYSEELDANYSSATTATPSPRPARHGRHNKHKNNHHLHHHHQHNHNDILQMRPPSEHIYSSIESEYSAYDQHEHLSMVPNGAGCSSNSSNLSGGGGGAGNSCNILMGNLTSNQQQQQQQFLIAQQQQPRVHTHPSPHLQMQQQQIWRSVNSNHAHLRTPSNISNQTTTSTSTIAQQQTPPKTQIAAGTTTIANNGNITATTTTPTASTTTNNTISTNNSSSGGQAFIV